MKIVQDGEREFLEMTTQEWRGIHRDFKSEEGQPMRALHLDPRTGETCSYLVRLTDAPRLFWDPTRESPDLPLRDGEVYYWGVRVEDVRGNPGRAWVRRMVYGHAELTTDLPLRLDLRSHSPDGFEWGYGGSGPAQLALALLRDALGDDETFRLAMEARLSHYQTFKGRFIAALPRDQEWCVCAADIRRWVARRGSE